MSEIDVQVLDEADWQIYRDLRLQALRESPDAFVASYEEESGYDEQRWRERMRGTQVLVAELDGKPVGMAALGAHGTNEQDGEILGLWVTPHTRRERVGWDLVRAGAAHATAQGRRRLYYWVGSDNGPAVGFASAFGFLPTSERRAAGGTDTGESPEEVAMVLSLSIHPGNPELP